MANMAVREKGKKATQKAHSYKRFDLRSVNAFTIDARECKSHDDAISITKTRKGWILGVYISDVADLAKFCSKYDTEAIEKAFLEHPLPMFNKNLSQNKLSLLPNVDRNVIAFTFNINRKGEVYLMKINKAVINSRFEGVYGEISRIINYGHINAKLLAKYGACLEEIREMRILYTVLNAKRTGKKCIQKGRFISSRSVINEFMILTGMKACEYLVKNNLPTLFKFSPEAEDSSVKALTGGCLENGLEGITQVTSPIRRIQDLKVHQILMMHLRGYTSEEIHRMFDAHLKKLQEKVANKSTSNGMVA